MSLDGPVLHEELTFHCPHCGFPKVKSGQWFRVVCRFTCEACGRDVPITYSNKMALFEKHTRLMSRVDSREIGGFLTWRSFLRSDRGKCGPF